jgi:putative nucleotidyltransferase with HDIG domain
MFAPNAHFPRQVGFLTADYGRVVTTRKAFILAAHGLGAVIVATLAAWLSEPGDWLPFELVLLLLALAVASDVLTVEVRGIRVSGAFLALVLAMVTLGPAPAAAIGAGSAAIDAVLSRRRWPGAMNNIVTWGTFPFAGALLFRELGGTEGLAGSPLGFGAAVLVVFMVTNTLNFLMVVAFQRWWADRPIKASLHSVHITLLPSEFATALLTAVVAYGYVRVGVAAVALAAIALFVFQYLVRLAVKAFDRGEELARRTRELAALQVGVLHTVMQTLSMRDAMTARHSAAVARYSREVASLLGADRREQDLIHTAALLHDIGKFIFPDSILLADRKLTEEEWETVKLHPEQGARLVRRIEGYGPVAEIIHSHHERVDGGGYPAGLGAEEIPLGSRIIAVADTYDVMTSRDSYRRPVSMEAAIAELRRVSGTQLDPIVVEAFVAMMQSGRVGFRHGDDADFELELGFERRVADYARPRVVA